MVYKDIGWFDVSVHHIRLVKDIKRTQDIVDNGNHMILAKLNCVRQIEYAPQIIVSHLHDDENVFQITGGHKVDYADSKDILWNKLELFLYLNFC